MDIAVAPIKITGIKFFYRLSGTGNNGGSEMSPALPLSSWPSPEWPERTFAAAAYPMSRIKGEKVSIEVSMRAEDNALFGKWIEIRALLDENGVGQTENVITSGLFQVSSAQGYSTYMGRTGYLSYELDTSLLWEEKVGVYASSWHWQYRKQVTDGPEEPWSDIVITDHEIFISLGQPTTPFHSANVSTEELAADLHRIPPPIDMLKLSCMWASGYTDAVSAATAITQHLHATGLFTYALDRNYTVPVNSPVAGISLPVVFKYMGFTDRMYGNEGIGSCANCADFSAFLMILCNCLGCDLHIGRLDPPEGASTFATNEILPAGFQNDGPMDFSYHEVAYYGEAFDEHAIIFDCSLSLLGVPPEGAKYSYGPVAGLRFGDSAGEKGYLSLLVAEKDQSLVQTSKLSSTLVVKFG